MISAPICTHFIYLEVWPTDLSNDKSSEISNIVGKGSHFSPQHVAKLFDNGFGNTYDL